MFGRLCAVGRLVPGSAVCELELRAALELNAKIMAYQPRFSQEQRKSIGNGVRVKDTLGYAVEAYIDGLYRHVDEGVRTKEARRVPEDMRGSGSTSPTDCEIDHVTKAAADLVEDFARRGIYNTTYDWPEPPDCLHPEHLIVGPHRDTSVSFNCGAYCQRHVIEECVGWLKELRRIGTRFEKRAVHFHAMLQLVMIRQYLKLLFSARAWRFTGLFQVKSIRL